MALRLSAPRAPPPPVVHVAAAITARVAERVAERVSEHRARLKRERELILKHPFRWQRLQSRRAL
eukprot:6653724-Prymnesium_polylepis.3